MIYKDLPGVLPRDLLLDVPRWLGLARLVFFFFFAEPSM